MAITRRNVLASATAAVLAVGVGGIAEALRPRPAEASIAMGTQNISLPGMVLKLGDYQARVPAGFVAQGGTDAIATANDPELAATLPHTWQLISSDTAAPLVITLVATPYTADELGDDFIERLNNADDIVTEAALLLDYLTLDASFTDTDPIYLDFLPYQDGEVNFNLLFFTDLQPRQVTAAAFLPGTGEAPTPTILTAIFQKEQLGLLLPAVDQLFGSLEPVQPETERLIETLEEYRRSRR